MRMNFKWSSQEVMGVEVMGVDVIGVDVIGVEHVKIVVSNIDDT